MAMTDRIFIMREAIGKLTQMLAGKSVQVTQRGISAYVRADAKGRPILVNLPYIPDNATDELLDAIQGFLDHEVAHILFTDFNAMDEAQRHNAGGMLNLIEDSRIERAMADRFQGSAENMARMGKFFLDKYTTPKMNEAIKKGDKHTLTGVLMVPLIRAMAGQQVFAEFMKDKMEHVEEEYNRIKDLAPQIAAASSTKDCLELAKTITTRLRDGVPKPAPKDEEEDPAAAPMPIPMPGGGSGKPANKSKGAGKNKSKPAPKDEEEEKDPTAGDEEDEKDPADPSEEEKDPTASGDESEEEKDPSAPSDEDEDEDVGAPGDEDDEGDMSKGTASDGDDGEGGDATGSAPSPPTGEETELPEGGSASWDAIDRETAKDYDDLASNIITNTTAHVASHADYLVYSKDQDIIEPLRVGREYKDSMLTALQDKVDHMVGPLQKDLERAIAARSLSQWNPGHRSGRLNASALSRLAVNDDRVFRRKTEVTSKDVAVELLIDMSGSMDGSKIHTAAQTAYALCNVLERIGIQCEAVCFTTGMGNCGDHAAMQAEEAKIGRKYSRSEQLYMPILKSFNERLSTDVKKRFGWLPYTQSMRNNVDGECVEIAGMRLMGRKEKGKILMVLSDGAPNCYGNTRTLGPHLKKVVENLTRAGLNVIGIGIESNDVERFYPKHMVLNKVEELPLAVMKELRQLILK